MKKVKDKKVMRDVIAKYIAEEAALCKRLKIERALCINFPKRGNIPILSRLALKVLRSQGGIMDIRFTPLK